MASKPLETLETRSGDSARAPDGASRRRSDHRETVALRPRDRAQAKRNGGGTVSRTAEGPALRRPGVAGVAKLHVSAPKSLITAARIKS